MSMMAVNFSQWAAHTEKKRIKTIFSITVRKNTIQKPLPPFLGPFLLWDISRPQKQDIPIHRVFLISWFFRLIFPLRAGAFFREKTHIAFPLHKEYDSIVKEPEKISKNHREKAAFYCEGKNSLKKSALFSAFPFPPAHFFPVTGGNRQCTTGNRLGTAKAPIVKNLTFHRETTHLSSFKTSPIIV